ncbi:hypothetical protein SOASR032_03550 [Pragia fontium]|uniref:Protein CyaE n=1 Tax=Pragia fontium TaxID=82985 RepID=A0ABQ5LDU2_9GAMM|nr:TolC family protein [Pragia fontium]GKX61786.1 hypothetical protein SOASR032_03550 [Pragia fontium]
MKKILLASLIYSVLFPVGTASSAVNNVHNFIDDIATSRPVSTGESRAVSIPQSETSLKELPDATQYLREVKANPNRVAQQSEGKTWTKVSSTYQGSNEISTESPLSQPEQSLSQSTSLTPTPAQNQVVVQDFSVKKGMEPDICLTNAASKNKLSFYEVVVLAMCNDPKAKATWLNLRHYQIAKDGSYAGYMPTVDLTSSFNHTDNTTKVEGQDIDIKKESWAHTLELSWLLFDFGQREASVDRAKSELIAVEFLSLSDLQDVVLDSAQKYFSVIAAEAYLDAARDIELIAYKSLQVTKAKREAGIGVLADELQAKNAALSATNYRIKAEGDVRNAMGALASVLGKNITKDISFQRGLTVPSQRSLNDINQLIEKALNQHPQLLSAKEQIRVSEKELDVAKRGFLPSVYFTSRWGNDRLKYGPGYDTEELYMGVNVKVPLFSGFSQYNAVRTAQNKVELTKNQLAQTRQDIALQVWQTYQRLTTAQNNLTNMSELVASSRKAYDIARGRYQSGVGSILELLNTQNDLSEAQMNNVNTMVDWHLARLALASSLGQLNVSTIKNSPLNQ